MLAKHEAKDLLLIILSCIKFPLLEYICAVFIWYSAGNRSVLICCFSVHSTHGRDVQSRLNVSLTNISLSKHQDAFCSGYKLWGYTERQKFTGIKMFLKMDVERVYCTAHHCTLVVLFGNAWNLLKRMPRSGVIKTCLSVFVFLKKCGRK